MGYCRGFAQAKIYYTFTVDNLIGFVYIRGMKNKELLILKAAKLFLRLRCKAAGTYSYYANPGMCLYGPHGGASYWGDYSEWQKACEQTGLEFVQYSDAAGQRSRDEEGPRAVQPLLPLL